MLYNPWRAAKMIDYKKKRSKMSKTMINVDVMINIIIDYQLKITELKNDQNLNESQIFALLSH